MQIVDTSLVIDTQKVSETYCVFEHHIQTALDRPPEVILVGACRLIDVHRLIEGKHNSEWSTIFAGGGHVMVRIVAVGTDKQEIARYAMQHARTFDPMPRCNLRGFSMKGGKRPIKDLTTGEIYPSQSEAANALGMAQSALSRHLRGELKHVGGRVFQYIGSM